MDSQTHKKVEELRMLEAQIQSFLAQKQSLQLELNEVSNALEELKNSEGDVYKIVSGVMLKSDSETLTNELNEKKKELDAKISIVEKQEKKLEQNASTLRKDVTAV